MTLTGSGPMLQAVQKLDFGQLDKGVSDFAVLKVVIAWAEHANPKRDDGRYMWSATPETIAQETGLGRSTVWRVHRAFQSAGWIGVATPGQRAGRCRDSEPTWYEAFPERWPSAEGRRTSHGNRNGRPSTLGSPSSPAVPDMSGQSENGHLAEFDRIQTKASTNGADSSTTPTDSDESCPLDTTSDMSGTGSDSPPWPSQSPTQNWDHQSMVIPAGGNGRPSPNLETSVSTLTPINPEYVDTGYPETRVRAREQDHEGRLERLTMPMNEDVLGVGSAGDDEQNELTPILDLHAERARRPPTAAPPAAEAAADQARDLATMARRMLALQGVYPMSDAEEAEWRSLQVAVSGLPRDRKREWTLVWKSVQQAAMAVRRSA